MARSESPRRLLTRVRAIALIAVTSLSLMSSVSSCSGSRTEGLDPSKLPENVRADYEVFAQRCSKCHSLARPLTAGITDNEQWVMYVNRMRRQPGSGITMDDQDQILRFLRYFASELRKKEAEKHGLVPPTSSTTTTEPTPTPTPTPTTTPAPAPSPSPAPAPAPAPAPVPTTDNPPSAAPNAVRGAG